jgi:hypothetical protein
MSAHVDPVPREARHYQGHRARLLRRTAAAVIDIGVVAIAMGVTYVGVFAVLFLLDPRSFTAPTPSPWLLYAAGGVSAMALSKVPSGPRYSAPPGRPDPQR